MSFTWGKQTRADPEALFSSCWKSD